MIYNDIEKMYIYLSSFDFLGNKKIDEILKITGEGQLFFSNFEKCKQKIVNFVITDYQYNEMIKLLDEQYIESYISSLIKQNIVCITINSDRYPQKLLDIESPPHILFCKGNLDLLETKSIAIVGTRKPTAYGRYVTQLFAKNLAKNGLTIVSGLAYGVDKIAHESALEVNGKTIAVLGCGFNHMYPSQHINLSNVIAEKGLLITEYRPSFVSTSYSFPLRNRIIAGLSIGVLLTEAGEKSGALHTKEYALDAGRDVFAVPGNINNEQCVGTNRIIKTAQCACVTSYEDVLNAIGIEFSKCQSMNYNLNLDESLLLNILKDGEKHFAELLALTKFDVKNLNSCLTTLQIRGIIKKLASNYYTIN